MSVTRILVVDDEENILALLARSLTREGYEVSTATDGERALKLLDEGRFDLALLDVRMAPMDGLSLLEHIKRRHPLTKAIMITGYSSHRNRMLALQKKAAAYPVKPFNMDDLKKTIAATLAS